MTAADAQRYYRAYEAAIHAIGVASGGRGIHAGPGISVKLSALHPRCVRAQRDRVMRELLPRVQGLLRLARQYDIGVSIDAEESDRLDISLDLLEALVVDPALAGWNGIGFVVQSYQKRCPFVIDYLIDLAHRSGHRLMIRLVKGAYWDAEIKRAQVDGQAGYPVFTRKVYTDVCYLACAKTLLAASGAVFPQFATHNAYSLAAIYHLGGDQDYEFQCLHGMGETLYDQVIGQDRFAKPCRIYAPVGTQETLLAYLVRRLLENGANSSFVNRLVDPAVSIDDLVADQVAEAARLGRAAARQDPPAARSVRRRAHQFPQLRSRRRTRSRGIAERSRGGRAGTVAGVPDAGRRRSTPRDRQSRGQPRRPRRYRGQRAPGERGRCGGGVGVRGRSGAALGRDDTRRARRLPRAHGGSDGRADAGADEPGRPRGRQIHRQRRGRGARGGGLLPLLREPGSGGVPQRHSQAAGAGRVDQPVELPPGDLRRPSQRCAGGRQHGAGEIGRADAADRGAGRASLPSGRRAARRTCNCCPGRAKSAPRWWPMRG